MSTPRDESQQPEADDEKDERVRERKDCWTTAGTLTGSRITASCRRRNFWTRTVTSAMRIA